MYLPSMPRAASSASPPPCAGTCATASGSAVEGGTTATSARRLACHSGVRGEHGARVQRCERGGTRCRWLEWRMGDPEQQTTHETRIESSDQSTPVFTALSTAMWLILPRVPRRIRAERWPPSARGARHDTARHAPASSDAELEAAVAAAVAAAAADGAGDAMAYK